MVQRTQQLSRALFGCVWGGIAGLSGSLCCLGPALAVVLGFGASSALAGLALSRTSALLVGLAFLGAGIGLAFRRSSVCGLSPTSRLQAPLAMLLTFALCYTAFAHLLPGIAANAVAAGTTPVAPPATTSLHRLTLSIPKMECPPCVAKVRALLAEQPGVAAFVAEQDLDEVTVDYDPAALDARAILALFPPQYQATMLADRPLP